MAWLKMAEISAFCGVLIPFSEGETDIIVGGGPFRNSIHTAP